MEHGEVAVRACLRAGFTFRLGDAQAPATDATKKGTRPSTTADFSTQSSSRALLFPRLYSLLAVRKAKQPSAVQCGGHACQPSTQEAEAGAALGLRPPGHRETLFQQKKKKIHFPKGAVTCGQPAWGELVVGHA